MNDRVDVGKAIGDHLETDGLLPTGGVAVVVEHVTMARVTVLHDNGRVDVQYRALRSSTIDPAAHSEMARRMVTDAQQRL